MSLSTGRNVLSVPTRPEAGLLLRAVREGAVNILKGFQTKTKCLAAESRAQFAKAGPQSSSSHRTNFQQKGQSQKKL